MVNSGERKKKKQSPSSKVTFKFDDEQQLEARCVLRAARNAGIAVDGKVPQELTDLFRGEGRFFSAYIPGISGIPNREEKRGKKVIFKSCSYGDSNVVLRNVLLQLELDDNLQRHNKRKSDGKPKDDGRRSNIGKIEEWIQEVTGQTIKISVEHDDAKDLAIQCIVQIGGGIEIPLELVGTGYLQLIQIFAYILLFSPGILLIDEPDTDLHPNVQERLPRVMARIASERNCRILLTTHSPFLVRGFH